MADYAPPNLPSRDFAASVTFYSALGFSTLYRVAGWLILTRGALSLEFFLGTRLLGLGEPFGVEGQVELLEAGDVTGHALKDLAHLRTAGRESVQFAPDRGELRDQYLVGFDGADADATGLLPQLCDAIPGFVHAPC